MDHISTREDALTNSESYSYDAAGNLSTFTDRRSKVTSYTYDPLNRRTFAGFNTQSGPTYDSTITYSYDAGDRLSSVVDSVTGTITPTFDGLNRVTEEQSSQGTVNYAYDTAGRRTSMTVAGQTAVDYSYDNANRLTGMTQGTSTSASFAYDNANKRTSLTLPNGVVVSYGYDSASQLTGLTYTNGSTTLGNLIYSYDLAGRRTSMGGSLAQQELPAAISTTAYNANNQLTTWGTASLYYDANGNMTSDGTNSYVWDARNHLASMNLGGVTFEYDGYGRRVGKTTITGTTNYLYDGANPVQELSGTTVTANLLTGSGVDERFTRTDSSGTANYLTDALGSTITLTNSSGSTLASYAYEPFGKTTVTGGSSANTYQYTGQVNDGTGVYFYRDRYYNPGLQRFVSEDPIGIAGGINLYAYVTNDPVGLFDPFGRDGQQQVNPLQQYIENENAPATDAGRYDALAQAGQTADAGVKTGLVVAGAEAAPVAAIVGGPVVAAAVVATSETLANNPSLVTQFTEGFVAGASPGPSGFPPTPAGIAGFFVGKGLSFLAGTGK